MTEGKKNIIAALMDEYEIETADDIQEALREQIEEIYGFECSEFCIMYEGRMPN